MAVNALSLAECLRPWRAAGLWHILAERDGAADDDFISSPDSGQDSFPVSGQDFSPDHGPGPGLDCSRPVRRERMADVPARSGGESAAAGRAGSGARGKEAARQHAENTPLEPDWPPAWAALFRRTKAAPIVWTYAELGFDLCGKGSPERSACLRRLIGSLALPKGSSAFWPVRLPEAPDSENSGRMAKSPDLSGPDVPGPGHGESGGFFQAGLCLLRPKAVVFLGEEAAALAGLEPPCTLFSHPIRGGVLHVFLPAISALLGKGLLFEQTTAFLRSARVSFPAIFGAG